MTTNAPRLGLAGRVALITGGTRGLGFATATKLVTEGCHVFLNYAHNDADAEKALKELAGLAGTATVVKGDVTDPEALASVFGEIKDRHGRLDIFVHNVASGHPMTALAAVPADVALDVAAAVNPLLTAAPLLAELMAGGPGRVVAVSNTGSRHVIPMHVSLAMAKSALENLVKYLAVEFAGRGVTVNAVTTAKLDKGPATQNAKMVPILAARTPAGRLTLPEDIANVIALLCTDEAAWIQGQVVCADGGLSLLAA